MIYNNIGGYGGKSPHITINTKKVSVFYCYRNNRVYLICLVVIFLVKYCFVICGIIVAITGRY